LGAADERTMQAGSMNVSSIVGLMLSQLTVEVVTLAKTVAMAY
jgi:hypothetical protein